MTARHSFITFLGGGASTWPSVCIPKLRPLSRVRCVLQNLLFVVTVWACVQVTSAYAHARLEHSIPDADSQDETAPHEVSILFTQDVEPAFSTIKVQNADGTPVDKGDSARSGTDKKLMRVSLTPLTPGTYKVIWRVLSIDGHVTEGEFKFSVAK